MRYICAVLILLASCGKKVEVSNLPGETKTVEKFVDRIVDRPVPFIPPTLKAVGIYPANAQTNVNLASPIALFFPLPVTKGQVELNFSLSDNTGATVEGVITQEDSYTYLFAPNSPLSPQTLYTIKINTNILGPDVASGGVEQSVFTTGNDNSSGTTLPDGLTTLFVYPGSTNVPIAITTPVHLFFSLPVASTTVASSLSIMDGTNQNVTVAITGSSDNKHYTVLPVSGTWSYDTTYSVTIDYKLSPEVPGTQVLTTNFKTKVMSGTELPSDARVVSLYPFDGQENVPVDTKIRVLFTLPTTPAEAQSIFNMKIKSSGEVVTTTAQAIDSRTVSFSPESNLNSNTEYEISVDQVVGGNNLGTLTHTFTTSDSSSGTVDPLTVSILPVNDATSVSIDTNIVALFNIPVTQEAIEGHFTMEGVQGQWSKVNDLSYVFQPSAPLNYETTYTVTVDKNLMGTYQGPMLEVSQFTTAANPVPPNRTITPCPEISGSNRETLLVVDDKVFGFLRTGLNTRWAEFNFGVEYCTTDGRRCKYRIVRESGEITTESLDPDSAPQCY